MNTDKVIILNGEKHFKLEGGDKVKEGDTYESSSGRYEDPSMTDIELPSGGHVDYYRPVRKVND